MTGHITHDSSEEHAGIRIHILQYQPTQRPIEDRFSINISPDSTRIIVGVYDGHGGTATSEHICSVLPNALLQLPPSRHAQIFRDLDKEMLSAFISDHSLLHSKSKNWTEHAQVIRSGCTALIIDVDLETLVATFANAGDCRAVVCGAVGCDEVQQTMDLNAKTASEQERLKLEHPNEDLLIVSGRLFGKLMSTRGFGDGHYKLPNGFIGNRQHRKYIDIFSSLEQPGKVPLNAQYDSYFYGYRTPPYVTAQPDVGHMQLVKGGFVIMATDGLWDLVTSEEAVGIVRRAIDQGVDDLAKHLFQSMQFKMPGDDVTILVLRV